MQQVMTPEAAGFSTERLSRVAPVLDGFMQRRELPGISALIARGGKIVYTYASGSLDIAGQRAMGEDAIVRIYSMSKPVTTAAALTLYEEGRFLLNEPISKFMPQFGKMQVLVGGTADAPVLEPARSPITVRDLMRHTSGIVYGDPNGCAVEQLYARQGARIWDETIAVMADKIASLPLHHHPGEDWHYGLSIDLLGRLIEVVSGQTLDVFMQERLFGPLGMRDTAFAVPTAKRDRLAVCYAPDGQGGLRPEPTPFDSGEAPAFLCGGGGLLSTARDYARFGQMLLNGGELEGKRVLSPRTVALMLANQTPPDRMPVVPATWSYRHGWGMALGGRTLVDQGAFGEVGSLGTYTWQGAAGTDFWIDPKESLCGVLLTQIMPGTYGAAEAFRVLTYQALVD